GRRFSRTEARRRFSADDLAKRMKGIEYRHGAAWVDEIPDAYKSIDQVMADSVDLVEVVTSLRQVVNVKGTRAARPTGTTRPGYDATARVCPVADRRDLDAGGTES